ncbi:MAG: DUF2200 domain-containing protein [Treponema sp.]|jgi:hypothetical protein|nr:DUF2200 domain-containing protein [Treponema sp.]
MAHNILKIPFADIYEMYIQKVERKSQPREGLITIITWLSGYTEDALQKHLAEKTSMEDFFNNFPKLNENAGLITGSICGYKVEEITDPFMQRIRYMDKLVDELAKGKSLEKILRK